MLLLACAAIVGAAPASRNPPPPELLAHGSKDRLWVVQTLPQQSANMPGPTAPRYRDLRGGDWRDMPRFLDRVVGLADLNGDLIALLESGSLRRIGPYKFNAGTPLPGNGKILAIAGGMQSLWAIGYRETAPSAAPASTTSAPSGAPATAPSATRAATAAASAPIALEAPAHATTAVRGPSISTRPVATGIPLHPPMLHVLRLWRFSQESGEWVDVADVPPGLPDHAMGFSMVVIGQQPYVAFPELDGTIRTCRLSLTIPPPDPVWEDAGSITPRFKPLRLYKMLRCGQMPGLWTAGERGAGAVYIRNSTGWPAEPVALRDPLLQEDSHIEARSLAVADDVLRLMAVKDGKLLEEDFDFTGASVRKLGELPDESNFQQVTLGWIMNIAVVAIMLVVVAAALLRRFTRLPEMPLPEDLVLAPLNLRLVAGMVDLLPIMIGLWLFHRIVGSGEITPAVIRGPKMVEWLWWMAAMVLLYFGHTLYGEVRFGRTIGKALFGLYVTGYGGQPPRLGALFLRNALRVVDLALALFPLLLILLTPLRQRLGDAAAGTVVVMPPPAGADDEQDEEDQEEDEDE